MSISKNKIKIAIVDDHSLFRKGVAKLLNMSEYNEYEVLFEAANGKELITQMEKYTATPPDIITMDINMPEMDGYESVEWLRFHHPNIKVLIISMVERDISIIRMIQLGVKGYSSKDIETEDLQNAIKVLHYNGYYFSEPYLIRQINSINQKEEKNAPIIQEVLNEFSEKQREFIRLACTEMTYAEIAQSMGLSPKTIDGYRDVTFERLGIKNRVALVLFAIRNNLIDSSS
jgi:DNA-binding NarL/FixJ family response regulator